MSPEQHAQLMRLFDIACELPRPQLQGWLAGLSGPDAALRDQLSDMLDADNHSEVFRTREGEQLLARDLHDSAVEHSPRLPGPETPAPANIGEYEVLERLGSGGMGSVYRARQRAPERIVALKTLHPWLVSVASVERFRFEAQALASLTHPYIPPVYAVGQHEGLVYFAMELVEGPPLSAFARERALSTRARVDLLARVSEAVHHAHLRGFVHRDLKPDNIRITADGTPRVLDFGIAAGLGERRAEIAGTPAYMSPEQCDTSAPVDVRTDVYSLGVMLFELLSGQLPIVFPKSKATALAGLKRTPSPRLSSVAPHVGRELDAIVARALEVNPDLRYASAAELADDLKRHLNFEPVKAYSDGALYRTSRFVRRNRLLVLVLAVGASISLGLFIRAQAALAVAEARAQRVRTAVEFMSSVLNDSDTGGRGTTIPQAIDRAAAKIDREKPDPHVELFLRGSIAEAYARMSEWARAREQVRVGMATWETNRLGDDDLLTRMLRVASEVMAETGETALAVENADKALTLERRFHGRSPDPHVATSLRMAAIAHRVANDFAGALELHRQSVAMERVLAESIRGDSFTEALQQQGLTLVTAGRFAEARVAIDEAVTLTLARYGADHPSTADALADQGWLEFNEGNLEAARARLTRAIEVRSQAFGPNHMRLANMWNQLAQVELRRGELAAAQTASEETLRIARPSFGENAHRTVWLGLPGLELLLAQGQVELALEGSRRAVDQLERELGADRTVTLDALIVFVKALRAAGREEEAARALSRARERAARMFGDERPRCRRELEALSSPVSRPF